MSDEPAPKTVETFFAGQPEALQLFAAVAAAMGEFGPVELRITRSQVAFVRDRAFAWVWMPGKYLRRKAAPLVLTFSFHRRDASLRWKEIVQTTSRRYTHHLELYAAGDIDDEVRTWLKEAWSAAA